MEAEYNGCRPTNVDAFCNVLVTFEARLLAAIEVSIAIHFGWSFPNL